ncbi:MAG: transglycosylase SLT domain-containing protein, partial [Proteobacteria bacterium]|nr:transglycosylase SLT domain-containing protein [Pseudomonadota bacterium]
TYLSVNHSGADSIRARFLLAITYVELDQFAEALPLLGELAGDATPVVDFVLFYKAQALAGLGRFSEAVDVYDQIRTEHPKSPLYHEARVEAASNLYYAGSYQKALKRLENMLATYPEYPLYEELLYLTGMCAIQLGKKEQGAEHLNEIVLRFPYKGISEIAQQELTKLVAEGVTIPQVGRERLYDRARRLRVNKHWEIANDAFVQLLKDNETDDRSSKFENRVRFQLALNSYARGTYAEALQYLLDLEKRIEADQARGVDRDDVYKYLKLTYGRLGDNTHAIEAVKKQYAGRSDRARNTALAVYHEERGNYKKAKHYYDKVTNKHDKKKWHYTWLLYKTGEYDQAYENFIQLSRRSSGHTRAKYLYWAARCQMNKGELSEARTTFEEVMGDYPLSYYCYQAHNRIVELQYALDAPDHVVTNHPGLNVDEHVVALYGEEGNVEGDSWLDVPAVFPLPMVSLKAKTETEQYSVKGNRNGVPSPETKPLVKKERIDDRIPIEAGHYHLAGPPFLHHGDSFDSEQNEHITHEKQLLGNAVDTPLPAYQVSLSYDGALAAFSDQYGELLPEFKRASFLFSVGLIGPARLAAREGGLEVRTIKNAGRRPSARSPITSSRKLYSHYIDNRKEKAGVWGITTSRKHFEVPTDRSEKAQLAERQAQIVDALPQLYQQMTLALMEVGDHHFVRRIAYEKGGWYRKSISGPAHDLWSMAYPRAFPHEVQYWAAYYDVDPYLLWALMTVESSYNPDSISHAQARGLLQVIPKTGLKIAKTMGFLETFGPHDLLDPELSIRFGAWYFKQLMDKFDGQQMLAMAGYNGGPHNVEVWLEMRGDEPMDEFIEEIPFDQSREYAKKVTRFYGLFRKIYEDEYELYIGQAVNPEYRFEPHY